MSADQEQNHVETTAPESYTGLQGEGGFGRHQGDKTLSELAQQFDVHSNQIVQWKTQLLEGATAVFGSDARVAPQTAVDVKTLHAKIGELTLENGFFVRCARQGGIAERKAMIDRSHGLPVTRQAMALGISRGSVYYQPRPVSAGDLAIMRRIDELHLDYPFAGSRMLRDLLRSEDVEVGRQHVATLMKRMGIEAIYRRPNTSKPEPGLDWFSRKVLSHRVSITMETGFCIEALEEALARHGKPDIFNTDQGSQFTSAAFTGVLIENGIAISMDGKGRWRDNVFVERLWRSVKYEEVYLKAYETVSEARASIGRYFVFFNSQRPHSSLDRLTPDQVHSNRTPIPVAA